jgi:hypothetical protein
VLSKLYLVNLQEIGLGVDGRTILEWVLKKWMTIWENGLIQLSIGIIVEIL